jgi:hypothetical protein
MGSDQESVFPVDYLSAIIPWRMAPKGFQARGLQLESHNSTFLYMRHKVQVFIIL